MLSFFLLFSAFMLLGFGINSLKKEAPAHGGEIHEGVVGLPNFINPLLSVSSSGKDLSYLTYSGLMRVDENGVLVPDLAESYTISDDGLTYTFKIRKKAVFQDRKPITAGDVVFTVQKAKDSGIKSPVASNWQGVEAKMIDDQTVQFILKTPYAPFIENTTLGILPKHIWENADLNQFTFSSYNFEPIGSGPYQVTEVKRNAEGAVEYYKLTAFKKYVTGQKNITTIYVHIYSDTTSLMNALRKGEIQSAADISPEEAIELSKEGYNIQTADLLRIFGVFFNQNQASLFTDKNVRAALNMAVDRKQIIDTVLYGYGNEEFTPLPQHSVQDTESTTTARNLLEKNGWQANSDGILEKKNGKETVKLAFTLTTSNNADLVKTASILKDEWASIGADVTIVSLDPSDLNQNVIRPRKYDALLFGEVTGRENDIYPFWHSSERKDPGLNIALYTNSKADKLLEKARNGTSTEDIAESLKSFEDIITEDVPAVFLYSPKLIYVVPKNIKGAHFPSLELAHERWTGIFSAYLNTKRVW